MAKYYAVQIVSKWSGFGEWEPTLYGGDYGRTIKQAISNATAGEHDPQTHERFELGKDNDKLADAGYEGFGNHGDIRGLIHNEPERVYAVETMYGLSYVGVTKIS